MSYFPENVWVEIQTIVAGLVTWTNIGGDIVSPIKVQTGFTDGNPLSRLAPGGDMRFNLNNANSTYDPSTTFFKGQKIRLRVKYGSLVKTKFFGYIDHIGLDVGTWGPRQAHVVCIDWLGLAAKTPVRAIAGMTNTTIDLAVAQLLLQMQMQPEATDFEVGQITLPSVFDQVTEQSTVYSELQNLVMGEWGYIYMRDGGQTLKVENSISRVGIGADYKTTSYYLNDGAGTPFLLEDASNFLLEDGTNFLLEGEPTSGSFNSDFSKEYKDISINHGDQMTNKISASAVPIVLGSSTLILYPFDIANGSTPILVLTNDSTTPFIIQGQYKDPTAGGAQISGSSMVTPVVTTDWLFNSKADGTGTDLSANLTIVWSLGQSGFKASVVNVGVAGYFTKLNVRGKPVYRYAPVETVLQDQRSIWDYGDYAIQFTRQYGGTTDPLRPYLFRILMRDKTPRTIVSNPKMNALDTLNHLAGFLALDIGDQIRIASTKPVTDALYYIQGVRFSILPGSEQITFDYVTAETLTWQPVGYTECALSFPVNGATTFPNIDFGVIPILSNLAVRTFSFRARVPSLTLGQQNYVLAFTLPNLGAGEMESVRFEVGAGPQQALKYTRYGSSSSGGWKFNTVAADNTWRNYIIMFDQGNAANNPICYIDNVLTALASGGGWTGTIGDEAVAPFLVGTHIEGTLDLENLAVYDRFLTTSEISTIHNGGTRLAFASYPAGGMKFFFGAIDDATYAARINSALLATDKLIDSLNGYIGVPKNASANGILPTLKAVA